MDLSPQPLSPHSMAPSTVSHSPIYNHHHHHTSMSPSTVSPSIPIPPTAVPTHTPTRKTYIHRLSDENSQDRRQFSPPPTLIPSQQHQPASPTPSPRQRRLIGPTTLPDEDLPPALTEWMTHALVSAGYIVTNLINEGSFGTVLRAKRVADSLWVAIKVIKKNSLSELDQAAVRKQAITLRALRHRYIAALYEDFEDSDHFYHVFEYLPGGDLYDRLEARGKPFSEPQVLFLARQLFYAVSYLHSKRAAHRDIKLENFVFETLPSDRRQVMKLIDFDLLVVRSAAAPPAELCSDMCGTILYVSPEIASAREHVPEQSDMWACGVMLYVLLSYQMPFQGKTGGQILRAVRTAEPQFNPTVWAAISVETRQLVRDLLNKNGALRPTAAEALERVKAIQALSQQGLYAGGRLRALTRGLRSVSLNIWDPSGKVVRRSRGPDARKPEWNDSLSRRSSRRSRAKFPEEDSSATDSVRSSFAMQGGSEAGSEPLLGAGVRSEAIWGANSLLLTAGKETEGRVSSEFDTLPMLEGVLARKRQVQHNRNMVELNRLPNVPAMRGSRRIRRGGVIAKLKSWMRGVGAGAR